ncbi:hypothetical protein D3C85_1881370 [compost metagenome]
MRVVDGVGQRLGVADLADHQHVRCLAHRAFQCVLVAVGVDADFALVHQRALVLEDEFDRVFHG